jgi:hypothetical protein
LLLIKLNRKKKIFNLTVSFNWTKHNTKYLKDENNTFKMKSPTRDTTLNNDIQEKIRQKLELEVEFRNACQRIDEEIQKLLLDLKKSLSNQRCSSCSKLLNDPIKEEDFSETKHFSLAKRKKDLTKHLSKGNSQIKDLNTEKNKTNSTRAKPIMQTRSVSCSREKSNKKANQNNFLGRKKRSDRNENSISENMITEQQKQQNAQSQFCSPIRSTKFQSPSLCSPVKQKNIQSKLPSLIEQQQVTNIQKQLCSPVKQPKNFKSPLCSPLAHQNNIKSQVLSPLKQKKNAPEIPTGKIKGVRRIKNQYAVIILNYLGYCK